MKSIRRHILLPWISLLVAVGFMSTTVHQLSHGILDHLVKAEHEYHTSLGDTDDNQVAHLEADCPTCDLQASLAELPVPSVANLADFSVTTGDWPDYLQPDTATIASAGARGPPAARLL